MVETSTVIVVVIIVILAVIGLGFVDLGDLISLGDDRPGPSPPAGPAFFGLIISATTDFDCVATNQFINITFDGVFLPFLRAEWNDLVFPPNLFIEDSQLRGVLGQSHSLRITNDQIPIDETLNFFHVDNGEQIFFGLSDGC